MTHRTSVHRHDAAILEAVHVHGVPVKTLAIAMGVSRQTIYRRMQRARIRMRRAAEAVARRRRAEAEIDDIDLDALA